MGQWDGAIRSEIQVSFLHLQRIGISVEGFIVVHVQLVEVHSHFHASLFGRKRLHQHLEFHSRQLLESEDFHERTAGC